MTDIRDLLAQDSQRTRSDVEAIPLDAAPSAIPDDPFRAASRIDPYWAALWSRGASSSWISRSVADYQIEQGIAQMPWQVQRAGDNPWPRIAGSGRNQWKRLSAMSAIDTWRTLSGEQMAAITGAPDLGTGLSGAMADLFAVGIADIGVFVNGLVGTNASSRANLYRPARTNVFEKEARQRLSWAEVCSVTAGLAWESGSQFDRHNVLATEFALRVAEFCEIGTVLGEKLSKWSMLAFEGIGLPPAPGLRNAADATLIRTDGARVAVELTASAGPDFERKVRGWAELLSNRLMLDSGLSVLFVVAPRPDGDVRPGVTASRVRTAIANATRDFPGVDFDRTAERMWVAEWSSYFPAPGSVHPSFFTLEAERATGATAEGRFERGSILDVFDMPFEPRERLGWDPVAVLRNTQALRSVPHWLRDSSTVREVFAEPIRALGFNRIPVPPPARPESFKGGVLGAGVGRAGDAQPPRRLRLRGA